MRNKGIKFIREPKEQDYRTVVVVKDLYWYLWYLVEFNAEQPMSRRIV